MGTLKNALRWIAAAPAALMAGFLILFPLHWLAQAYRLLPDHGDPIITNEAGRSIFKSMRLEDLERMGQALIVPATIVLVASYVAPRARFVVSVTTATILVSALALAYFYLSSTPNLHLNFGAIPFWLMVVLWSASLAGALLKTYTDRAMSDVK